MHESLSMLSIERFSRVAVIASVLFLSLLSSSSNAHAKKVKKLTPQIVTAFIEKTTDLTSGKLDSSSSQIKSFLKRHLHDDARFRSTILYNIPGHPAQESSIALNKSQFIESIQDGGQKIEDYYNEVQVGEVDISSDGRKATVQTHGRETGIMTISPDGMSQDRVPIEGTSTCRQIIMISKRNVVQLYNANCETIINFKEN